MNILKKLFKKKEEELILIQSYADFWNWFQKNQAAFYNGVNTGSYEEYHDKLSDKLNDLRSGYFFLSGMYDDNTAELIITADGDIKNLVFVEELIAAAPSISGWRFTAHKPEEKNIENYDLEMDGYQFNLNNIFFYANELPNYPNEIDITIAYRDYKEEDLNVITNGIYIFLDIFLGELNSVTTIDSVTIIDGKDSQKELVPIEKLKSFLIWREKEFIEKYKGTRHNLEDDSYSILEAEYKKSGNKMVAVINTDVLNWDAKASHPWIAKIKIEYNGDHNNGMPNEETSTMLYDFEDAILPELKDYEGHLYIGRQTGESTREFYFACQDFRHPSKVLDKFKNYFPGGITFSYTIYKDKYWRSFNRFIPVD